MKNRSLKTDPSVIKPKQAICGRLDKPLVIGNVKIQCYVLEDGTRVVTTLGLTNALGFPHYGNRPIGGFLASLNLTPNRLGSNPLEDRKPIPFKRTEGPMATGYDARLIPRAWRAILESAESGTLSKKHTHLVPHCRAMAYAVMDVGIIALVDEATGFQELREKGELQRLLDLYIAEHSRPWTKMFPLEFFEEIARLKGWRWKANLRMSRAIGHLINSLVYKRLPQGVLDALQEKNPQLESKQRKVNHHQLLTEDRGRAHIQRILNGCCAIMRASSTWEGFLRAYERAHPLPNRPPQYELIEVEH